MSEKKRRRAVTLVVLFMLFSVIALSLHEIGKIMYGYRQGRSTYLRIAEEAGAVPGREKDDEEIRFRKIIGKYPDVKAWIRIKGTVINYPVAQGRDNDWYLHHTLDGSLNGAGTIFIDRNNEHPFEDFLTIIYGHHMRDGSMFGSLVKYRDRKYYKKHKTIKLYTPGKNYNIKMIGACTIPGNSERYRTGFRGRKDRQEYLDWISRNTEIVCNEKASAEDRMVMLSTCTYEFDDARFVLFGKLEERDDRRR